MPRGGKSKLQDPYFSNPNPDAAYQEEAIVAIIDSKDENGFIFGKVLHY